MEAAWLRRTSGVSLSKGKSRDVERWNGWEKRGAASEVRAGGRDGSELHNHLSVARSLPHVVVSVSTIGCKEVEAEDDNRKQ